MKEVDISEAMKEGMRRLGSGVAVISCFEQSGKPTAMTATSVTSVSDDPASLLVCVNRQTTMYHVLTEAEETLFAVNLLHNSHEDVSNHCAFADPEESRVAVGDWNLDAQSPILSDCLAAFICRLDKMIDYGTHGIFIGVIETVMVNEEQGIDPLLYLNSTYGTFKEAK